MAINESVVDLLQYAKALTRLLIAGLELALNAH